MTEPAASSLESPSASGLFTTPDGPLAPETSNVAFVRAEPIALHRRATVAQAFAVIGFSCLRQLTLNQPGVRAGNEEAIHQMRVGLRRLRTALSLFHAALS